MPAKLFRTIDLKGDLMIRQRNNFTAIDDEFVSPDARNSRLQRERK